MLDQRLPQRITSTFRWFRSVDFKVRLWLSRQRSSKTQYYCMKPPRTTVSSCIQYAKYKHSHLCSTTGSCPVTIFTKDELVNCLVCDLPKKKKGYLILFSERQFLYGSWKYEHFLHINLFRNYRTKIFEQVAREGSSFVKSTINSPGKIFSQSLKSRVQDISEEIFISP